MGKREANKASKERRILSAAEALFAQHGFEAVTIRDIAKHAKVAVGTVFLYAPSKEALAVAVFDKHTQAVTEQIDATLDPEAPPLEQLVHAFGLYLRLFAAQPHLSRVLMRVMAFATPQPGLEPPAAHGIKLLEVVAGRLLDWRGRGWLRDDVDLNVAATTLVAVHVGHIIMLLSEVLGVAPAEALPIVIGHLRESLALTLRGWMA